MFFFLNFHLVCLFFQLLCHSARKSAVSLSSCTGTYLEDKELDLDLPVRRRIVLSDIDTISDDIKDTIVKNIKLKIKDACGNQYSDLVDNDDRERAGLLRIQVLTAPPCYSSNIEEAIKQAVPGIAMAEGSIDEEICTGPVRAIPMKMITPRYSIRDLEAPFTTPDYPSGITCAICGREFSEECKEKRKDDDGRREDWEKFHCAWRIKCPNRAYRHYFHYECMQDWPSHRCPTCNGPYVRDWYRSIDDYKSPEVSSDPDSHPDS